MKGGFQKTCSEKKKKKGKSGGGGGGGLGELVRVPLVIAEVISSTIHHKAPLSPHPLPSPSTPLTTHMGHEHSVCYVAHYLSCLCGQ